MDEGTKIPKMMEWLFGEAAMQGAGERLRRWSQAFEEWLEERKRKYMASTNKPAIPTWRRLLRERRKMPWEMRREDIEQHAAWMKEEGYAAPTIANGIGIMANFYRWCTERKIDPECEAGFNPAAEAARPKVRRYAGATLLSRGEMRALLDILKRDGSELGKRDYALILARSRLGVSLQSIQRLKWGQIEQDETGAWVRWRAEAERGRLPGEVWEAIRAYLATSGRLEGMQEGKYIFAPLANPYQGETGSRAEDWHERRCLSTSEILHSLKLYGRLAGIAEEKLTMMALHRTAIRMRMDEADSLEEMQAFLDSQEEPKATKYRLGRLPALPQGEERADEECEFVGIVPVRKAKPFKAGEVIHGLYARSQPPEVVKEMLKENIRGIDEEIMGMRILGRGLLERQSTARNGQEAARLGDAYTRYAQRLAEMIGTEEKIEDKKTDKWAEEFLALLNRIAIEHGGETMTMEQLQAEASGSRGGLGAGDRRLVEEIAATRHVLRNTFYLAMEAEEPGEYMQLTEVYNTGCNRLVRMLRRMGKDQDKVRAYLKDAIDQAIDEVTKELGLRDRG